MHFMTMPRIVVAETLDHLDTHNPDAIQSRRDLQLVHRVMGTRKIILGMLCKLILKRNNKELEKPRNSNGCGEVKALRILELGAGDGTLMLSVAAALKNIATANIHQNEKHPLIDLTLLDQQALVKPTTIADYAALGWAATSTIMDVLDWAKPNTNIRLEPYLSPRWDLIMVNLFLHHFEGAQLAMLLSSIESRADRFFACEPSRGWFALAGSHLIGALGVNAVTREDAVLSVRAGFRDTEITALWPAQAQWNLREYSAGLFSHCFKGERRHLHHHGEFNANQL